MYGCRVRPQDLDLRPTKMAITQKKRKKEKKKEKTRDRKALEAHSIATNM